MIPIRYCTLGILLVLGGRMPAQTGGGYKITTLAGGFLGDGGPATSAALSGVFKAITDAAGNLYITDREGHRIRKVSASGTIATIAGTGVPGFTGDEQAATSAQINGPTGMALDAQGNLLFCDSGNNRIRAISPAGIISTVVGGASATQLSEPRGIAFDTSGTLYLAEYAANRLSKLTPTRQLQVVTRALVNPGGIDIDLAGNIVVADSGRRSIVRVTPAGVVTVIAGADGSLSWPSDVAVDRTGIIYIADTYGNRIRKLVNDVISTEVAGLSGPRGVWLDAGGALYIADSGTATVRKLESGTLRTVAGGASRSRGDGGPATSALLNAPRNVIVDSAGNVLIADTGNHKVRKVSPDGTINLVAGTGTPGGGGDGGTATAAQLNSPVGLAYDGSRNLYIGDAGNGRLMQVRPAGDILTLIGLFGPGDWGDGGGVSSAGVREVHGIAWDGANALFLADTRNNRIRRIRDGYIDRYAGTSYAGAGGDDIAAIQSSINGPMSVVVGKDGLVYFSDTNNHRVRRVLANGNVETIAGSGTPGFSGDNGAAKNARLNNPTGLAVDADGSLIFADSGNHRLRQITSGGLIRTIAGSGVAGFSGDDGAAISAQLNTPIGVAVDSRGNIYVADRDNHRIRRLTPDASTGRLAITAGNSQSGNTGARLPVPLTVRLTSLAGAPVSGVSISFVVTRGSASLSASSAKTDADGVASVTVTLGGVPGEVTVVASAPGLLPVQFQLTVQGAIVTGQPRIFAGGVVGAGLSVPKVRQLAALGLYTIFGENFAQPDGGWQLGPGDLQGGQVPTRFQGVCVQVGGAFARVFQVYPGQISFQAPRLNAVGAVVPVQVILNCNEKGEVRSNVENVVFGETSPEFFFFVRNDDGRNPAAAVNAVTGVYVGTPGLIQGGIFAPAKPGDYVTIFGTGLGPTNPFFFEGDLPNVVAAVTGAVSITLGGQRLSESDILYIGVTPGFAGLYQANIRVPADAAEGDLPLGISVSGVRSPDGAYLTIKK